MMTDFQLHAFVDHQLSGVEQSEILQEAAVSADLARRIATLQHLKELVRHAYQDAQPPDRRDLRRASSGGPS